MEMWVIFLILCIFESVNIGEELETYNAMIPDGTNWKATFMVEYADEQERRAALAKLIGIERGVWMQVAGFDKVQPIADEDLERETEAKTSAVHFLRLELDAAMIAALKSGGTLAAGITHSSYEYTISPVAKNIRDSLVTNLN